MSDAGRPSVVVIGVGNSALSDEGVAGRIVGEVARKAPSGVEVVDAGLPGPGLIAILEGRTKAIIVDAVDAGQPPGTIYRFSPDQAVSDNLGPAYSLHQGDILQYAKLAAALGMAPKEVVIIGIQPESFDAGERLSPAVAAAVPQAVALALAEAGCDGSPTTTDP